MNPPHVDYVFAGQRTDDNSNFNANAALKTKLSSAFAYSRLRNRRNIEHPWYGPWAQLWIDFVRDLQTTFVIPQYTVYYTTPTDEAATTPEDDPMELADTSITSDTPTLTEKFARSRIPDFSVACVNYTLRPSAPTPPTSFLDYRIENAAFPLVAENKRGAPRGFTGEALYVNARIKIFEARLAIMQQAAYLFQMYPDQQSVILVACSGEFWSYRIVGRFHVARASNPRIYDYVPPPREDDVMEDSEELGMMDVTDAVAANQDNDDVVVHVENMPTSPSLEMSMQTIAPGALYKDDWSGMFMLNTDASNQRFRMIHDRIEAFVADMGMGI